jgi:hypothetical protein
MITGEVPHIRRHLISTYESFTDFGFREFKVIKVPPIVIGGIVAGREITSSADRASRLAQFQA